MNNQSPPNKNSSDRNDDCFENEQFSELEHPKRICKVMNYNSLVYPYVGPQGNNLFEIPDHNNSDEQHRNSNNLTSSLSALTNELQRSRRRSIEFDEFDDTHESDDSQDLDRDDYEYEHHVDDLPCEDRDRNGVCNEYEDDWDDDD